MKVNIGQQEASQQQQPQKKKTVVISTNLKRERVTLDKDGNEINFRTKQIIKLNQDM